MDDMSYFILAIDDLSFLGKGEAPFKSQLYMLVSLATDVPSSN